MFLYVYQQDTNQVSKLKHALNNFGLATLAQPTQLNKSSLATVVCQLQLSNDCLVTPPLATLNWRFYRSNIRLAISFPRPQLNKISLTIPGWKL